MAVPTEIGTDSPFSSTVNSAPVIKPSSTKPSSTKSAAEIMPSPLKS